MKQYAITTGKLVLGALAGYALSHHFSHPNGRVRKHVPPVRVGNVQLMPNLLIATKNGRWHIHHWAYLPATYLPLLTFIRPLLKRHLIHGFVLGAIIHGLTFSDRFTFNFQEN